MYKYEALKHTSLKQIGGPVFDVTSDKCFGSSGTLSGP